MLRELCEPDEHAELDKVVAQVRRDGHISDENMCFIYRLATRPKYADGTPNTHQEDYLRQTKAGGIGNSCIYSDAIRELH